MSAATGIRRLGDRALLVELPNLEAVLAARDALAATRPVGVDDIVPAALTVAVLFDPSRIRGDEARAWVRLTLADPALNDHRASAAATPGVVIDVIYDGDDLAEVAGLLGVPVDELVQRHTAQTWRVAFDGFAPGFGYLVTEGEWFQVPRRSSPRTSVPAGSVALAGGFSGVYPRQGPGGWQLIGRTDAPLWRPRASAPALLAPGTVVRFRAVRALAVVPSTDASSAASTDAPSADFTSADSPPAAALSADRTFEDAPHAGRDVRAANPHISGVGERGGDAGVGEDDDGGDDAAALTVLRSGPQLLVEDLGRAGSASIGAGRSGALDRGALRLANRLVGNLEGAAGLEVVVGAELRFERSTWFAVTGARGALRLGGHPIDSDAAVRADAGDVLTLGNAEHGLRYVIALRGGVRVPHELGSASTDLGAGIGSRPLADGDAIAVGDRGAAPIPAVDALTVWSPPDDEVQVRVVPGPRDDWFTPASVAAFYDSPWQVTPAANRVGVRVSAAGGQVLERAAHVASAELASEPMVPGAIQVPPSGEPTVLLADGPVTGGYPVIAVVADADLDSFAQLRPGQRLRFRHAR